jgi:hypothetical protein
MHGPAAPVDDEDVPRHRTVDACQTIRNYPGIFERMRRSKMIRSEECIESHGGHYEHLLLMYSFSYNTQIKCSRTHVHMDNFTCFGMWNSCSEFVGSFQLQNHGKKGKLSMCIFN